MMRIGLIASVDLRGKGDHHGTEQQADDREDDREFGERKPARRPSQRHQF